MANFSDQFPDMAILNILGDDLEHIAAGGGSEIFKCEFEFKYLEEEIGDQIDIIFPVAEVSPDNASKTSKRSRFKYKGVTYKMVKKRPVNVGKVQLILSRT